SVIAPATPKRRSAMSATCSALTSGGCVSAVANIAMSVPPSLRGALEVSMTRTAYRAPGGGPYLQVELLGSAASYWAGARPRGPFQSHDQLWPSARWCWRPRMWPDAPASPRQGGARHGDQSSWESPARAGLSGSRSVSGVLSGAVIHLGRPLPAGSRRLPGA